MYQVRSRDCKQKFCLLRKLRINEGISSATVVFCNVWYNFEYKLSVYDLDMYPKSTKFSESKP